MIKNTSKLPFELSARELDVMNVLWHTQKATIASEIVKQNPELKLNTVNTAIKNLLKKKLVKIDDYTYSGTVIARSYIPLISLEEYTLNCLNILTSGYAKLSKEAIVIAMLSQEENNLLLSNLENIVSKYKKEHGIINHDT